MTLTAEEKVQLETEGFVVLKGVLSKEEVGRVRDHLEALWSKEGLRAGSENYFEQGVRRLANLADKGDIFRGLFAHPLVLEAVRRVVGPSARLSMLNAREIPPDAKQARQPFHCDTDHAGVPDADGFYSCTALWMLDPFTPENGATRVIPGSHRTGKVPFDVLADPCAEHPDEVVLEGTPGDMAVFNGHCWHAGGTNQTGEVRLGILAHYARADIPLAPDRRQSLRPEVVAHMGSEERELLGLNDRPVRLPLQNMVGYLKRTLRKRLASRSLRQGGK